MMEEERRRKAEHERRRRTEERLALEEHQRRREMEMMQRQRGRSMVEQNRQQRLPKKQASRSAGSYPPGTIVRGPDGNLYRVVAPPRPEREDSMESFSDTSSDSHDSMSTENRGNEVAAEEPTHQETSCDDKKSKELATGRSTDSNTAESVSSMQKKEPLNEIIVENVPDEEDEELKEMHSVWRNRVPSPGQWLEPVEAEAFCGMRQ